MRHASSTSSKSAMTEDRYTGVCWWDGHFATRYVRVPTRVTTDERRLARRCFYKGYFCSYSCMVSWIDDQSSRNAVMFRESMPLIYQELRKKYKFNINKKIRPAPHYSNLRRFGGAMTIVEFRKNLVHPKKGLQQMWENSKQAFSIAKISGDLNCHIQFL